MKNTLNFKTKYIFHNYHLLQSNLFYKGKFETICCVLTPPNHALVIHSETTCSRHECSINKPRRIPSKPEWMNLTLVITLVKFSSRAPTFGILNARNTLVNIFKTLPRNILRILIKVSLTREFYFFLKSSNKKLSKECHGACWIRFGQPCSTIYHILI